MRIRVWSVLAAVLLVAACGGPKPQAPEKTRSGPPDTSNEINGDASDPVNKLVIQTIADLEKYWGKEMPELYQKDFEPITGGYYPSSLPPMTHHRAPALRARLPGMRSTARPRTSSPGTPKNCYPHCGRSTATSSFRW
jgi:hypothetical protein